MTYNIFRRQYLENISSIQEKEHSYFDQLINGLIDEYSNIEQDFNEASNTIMFWKKYAPRQRGRMPKDESFPWGEVGEKVLDAYLYKIILKTFPNVRFVGTPYGHDTRFVTDDAFIHIDVKSTGPNDELNEVVASPNQVSGNGISITDEGVINSLVHVKGPKASFYFQPELPPFYIINGIPKLTLTYYLKCVYEVKSMGNQPLSYLELISVPNGLTMFDSINYSSKQGLLIPGKDTKDSKHKRTRIRLQPLSEIDQWRCIKLVNIDGRIETHLR